MEKGLTPRDVYMNGVFDTGLSFWQLIALIGAVVASLVVIRVTLKFDINRYLENRQKNSRQKLTNFCTHMEISWIKDGQFKVQSLFVPLGTPQWQCQRCSLVRHQADDDYMERAQYYINNINEYVKQNRKFRKLLKKSGWL